MRGFPAVVAKAGDADAVRRSSSSRRPSASRRSEVGGPYALAISARSDIFQEFEGGPGQIAIHGTDGLSEPLGSAASHGCIRLSPSAITWLAQRIGGGSPVTVRALMAQGPGGPRDARILRRMERDLRETPLYQEIEAAYRRLAEPGFGRITAAGDVRASPDGTTIAFRGARLDALEGHASGRICLAAADGSGMRQVTHGPNEDSGPRWSPDGRDALVPLGSRRRPAARSSTRSRPARSARRAC